MGAAHRETQGRRLGAQATATLVDHQLQLRHGKTGQLQLILDHVLAILGQAIEQTAAQRLPGRIAVLAPVHVHRRQAVGLRQLDPHLLKGQAEGQLPGVFPGLGTRPGQRLRPHQRQRQAAGGGTGQLRRTEHRCRLRRLPQQAQVTRRQPRQGDFMLLHPLVGKGQARHLPIAPGLPVLQVVAGLDAETLEAVALAAPIQDKLLQWGLDRAGIQQPAAQHFFAGFQLTRRAHLDQGAVGRRPDPHARRGLGRIGRVVQREPLHIRQAAALRRLRLFLRQGIGLGFTGGIEYPHITEVGLACAQLQRQRQLQAIPGTLATQGQGHLGVVVGGFFLGERRQRRAQRHDAQPARAQCVNQDDTPSVSSVTGSGSGRLGGSGAK